MPQRQKNRHSGKERTPTKSQRSSAALPYLSPSPARQPSRRKGASPFHSPHSQPSSLVVTEELLCMSPLQEDVERGVGLTRAGTFSRIAIVRCHAASSWQASQSSQVCPRLDQPRIIFVLSQSQEEVEILHRSGRLPPRLASGPVTLVVGCLDGEGELARIRSPSHLI
jgi:hypothetical protein